MPVAIVTDSTADLPPGLAAELGITVIPLEVRLGKKTFRDGMDLGTDDLFGLIREDGSPPRTSQPPLGDLIRAYESLALTHEAIVSIHISASFSGTVGAAELAGRAAAGADVTVVDSGSFTLGLGLQVLAAARAAREGRGRDEILRLLAETAATSRIVGVLDNLDYLRLGGRINRVSHLLGALLRVKPVIRVGQGRAEAIGMLRRQGLACEAILTRLEPLLRGRRVRLGVMHTIAEARAGELRRRLEDRYGPVELCVQAGPVVACHVGPGALGVAVLPVDGGFR